MDVGKRIKIIRLYRNFTQEKLGNSVGFGGDYIRKYELGSRSPKDNVIKNIAEVLDASYYSLKKYDYKEPIDFVETMFWFEEFQSDIDLFAFATQNSKNEWKYDAKFNKYDADRLIDSVPVGIAIRNQRINEMLNEWLIRKQELQEGKITREEYFEWKINYPESADGCGKFKPLVKWRKEQ